jgi:hypothetical protein
VCGLACEKASVATTNAFAATAEADARHPATLVQRRADAPAFDVLIALARAVIKEGQDPSGHGCQP